MAETIYDYTLEHATSGELAHLGKVMVLNGIRFETEVLRQLSVAESVDGHDSGKERSIEPQGCSRFTPLSHLFFLKRDNTCDI